MRIAAVPIEAFCHEAFIRAVGVFDAEVEIAVDREAEAYDHADHPNREGQGLILERPMRCEDRVQERQAEPAAKKRQTHALVQPAGRTRGNSISSHRARAWVNPTCSANAATLSSEASSRPSEARAGIEKRSYFRVLRSRIGLRLFRMTIGAIRWRTRKLCLLG